MAANSPSVTSGVYAVIDTSAGKIVAELFPSSAPKTVANFVDLANAGFFNNLVWHRIVGGFVIQTGDPQTKNGGGDRRRWGTGGSEKTVPLEVSDTSRRNDIGSLGMARSQNPNSGSSQFYINLADNAPLNGQYTVFGKVITGLDVAKAIGGLAVDPSGQPVAPAKAMVTSIAIRSTP
ncbi:MAG: peptidylprolyl isomerase [Thaumarchaeota archaeon]|nr:peptidylprolyl isomerase [Nitrososphaerota archaeon]